MFDDYRDASGRRWRGISVNRRFAQNVLRWLTFQDLPTGTVDEVAGLVHALVHQIEVGLHDIVTTVLKAEFGERWWYEGLPEGVRLPASDRHEIERGQAPKEAYLDLVHYKDVIEKRWRLFEPYFLVGGLKDKAAATGWIDRVNELRRRDAHAVRRMYQPFQATEVDELRHHARHVSRVREQVAKALGRPVGQPLH